MNITVATRQTLFDIAIQYCGSVEAAYQIALLNNISLTDAVKPGTLLQIPSVVNISVVQFYNVNKINPATRLLTDQEPGGIGSWILELDFKVS